MRRFGGWRCLSVVIGGLGVGCGVYLVRRSYRAGAVRTVAAASPVHPSSSSSSEKTDSPSDADMTLRCAQIFFRHGARTPLRHLPNVEEVVYASEFLLRHPEHANVPIEICALDGGPRPATTLDEKYAKTKFMGGCVAGQVTTLGKDQAYMLGKRLKERYQDKRQLIGQNYNSGEVVIRSTNVNRCIESLQCVIAGMYGVRQFSKQDPVVIPVSPFPQEILFPNLHHCFTLNMLEKKVFRNEAAIPGVKTITRKINAIIGYNGPLELMQWRDHIYAREAHGLRVPDFMLDLRDEIEEAAVESLKAYMCGLPEDRTLVLQLGIGPALNMIQERFEKTVTGTDEAKLYLYSCHDSSLVPILTALGAYDNKWPPYTADISFEMLEDKEGQFWVRVLYCDEELKLNGQSKSLLPLSAFKEILKPYRVTPDQFTARCKDAKLARSHAAHWDEILSSPAEGDEEMVAPHNM